MFTHYPILATSPFAEFTSVKVTDAFDPVFDVKKRHKENLQFYCQALIDKVFQLQHSEISNFLDHHCKIARNSMSWLNNFEELVFVNEELFYHKKDEERLIKLQTCIELKRNELKYRNFARGLFRLNRKQINAESEERYFSFWEIREKLKTLDVFEQKIMLLTDEKYNYQQANIDFINCNLPNFDEQCDKEIEHLSEVKKLEEQLKSIVIEDFQNLTQKNKIRIHCNLNQLVDVFFQLNRELFIEGKPFLDGNTNDFVVLICNNFVDKEGKDISPDSVRTILTPSKSEKRPKAHRRIDLDKML